jgi:hypothetical protein
MDLPVWQKLYSELSATTNFLPITVAFDSAGNDAAGPWIRAANPTYPSLIDRQHVVADLYDMVNVPIAVWVNEDGRLVRPPEPAGTNDAFRAMDPKTFALPADARASLGQTRQVYLAALRDWAEKGDASEFALSEDEVLRRLNEPSNDHAVAAVNFRMGEYLFEQGHAAAAQGYFDEAKRLRPESWAYRRQAWALEEPGKAGGPEFWSAVSALGDGNYYAKIDMPGIRES